MSSTCFEPEGSSLGRRLYIQVWYGTFYMHQYKQSSGQTSVLDNNIKILIYKMCISLVYIVYLFKIIFLHYLAL
jgi:hypothetical protein